MPLYVQYGPLVGLPPVVATNAVVYGFFLRAGENGELTDLCKKVFEEPTKTAAGEPMVKCEPLDATHVMVTFATIAAVKSAFGGVPVSENEVLLQVPVKVTASGQAPFNAFFAPYVIIDNPASITGGREIYGYAKTYGNVTPLPPIGEIMPLSLQAFGGDAGSPALGLVPLIDVMPQALNPLALVDLLAPLTVEFQALVNNVLADKLNPPVRQIFLKQFQDVDGIHASVQQIAYADYAITPIAPPELLGFSYNVTIHEVGSHPAKKELGILSPQVVDGGFVLMQNFTLTVPQVLWP